MRPAPYIGISGIMSRNEIAKIECRLPSTRPSTRRPVAFGVLISAKTIRGTQNKYPNRYPRPEQLQGIFEPWNKFDLLTLHYSSDSDFTLIEDVAMAINAIGRAPDALQINMGDKATNPVSPHPSKVAVIAGQWPRMRIIVQLGMYQPDDTHLAIERVGRYRFCMTDVLIDGSCGRGRDMFKSADDVESMRRLVVALRCTFPHLGIGIAGGLCVEALPRIAELLRDIPDLSIDAEGRLRDEDDRLIVDAAVEYAVAANRILSP